MATLSRSTEQAIKFALSDLKSELEFVVAKDLLTYPKQTADKQALEIAINTLEKILS